MRKKMGMSLLCLFLLCLVVGCGTKREEEPKETVYYQVSFNSNGGTEIGTVRIRENGLVPEPNTPYKEGYSFLGWYYEDRPFPFDTPITSDLVLEARWRATSSNKHPSNSNTTDDSYALVPNCIGEDSSEAETELERLGLLVTLSTQTVSNLDYPNAKEGTIISQSSAPNTRLLKGSVITLTVAEVEILYPDFTDGSYTVEDVQNFGKQYGVVIRVVYSENPENSGHILLQSRKARSKVINGSTLTITVAR